MTRFRIRSAAATHVGAVRTVNEDSILSRDDLCLWVVADGMGGHANGQWASTTLVETIDAVQLGDDDPYPHLLGALYAGNGAIVRAGAANCASMGTTVVVLHLGDREVTGLWVGDSRIYRRRDGVLSQLTRDHSMVQELVDRGSIAADEAETHPMAHVLSRAVGMDEELSHDAFRDEAAIGDVYLLCSDGLSKVLTHDAIDARLAASPARAVEGLIADTLAAGAPDNVSVIVVSLEQATMIAPASGVQAVDQ
ncbi:PP2C family protein-serine/threonine phosphatase [Polymorphobacter fuscus]|uniref:Serine/threonine-protein phosphatase n=1 Tax=Sandarakinorhabdus fusca TaxID=1439888 RepID=A0A7C9KGL7_9SPHN|nr:protein phosphatase 2C domain-containing protein [Polymorphobacter fuscus]KAB7648273.1 serine/threonine-protein phosphatase [Polymorphobacter fuscus]MQT15781.1 serine/threonine-protein phosphatase [Polymorphobacter fuscus]NJC07946.1 serine/threonine protein phosphatase PrpC [Polymorphobacter fuscus]